MMYLTVFLSKSLRIAPLGRPDMQFCFELAWSEHKLGTEEVKFSDAFSFNQCVCSFECFCLFDHLLLSLFREPFQCDI